MVMSNTEPSYLELIMIYTLLEIIKSHYAYIYFIKIIFYKRDTKYNTETYHNLILLTK